MVSRQETARQLLTPGEVMQLPSEDEIILVSGVSPIRANKIRYYSDKNFKSRVSPAPVLNGPNHPYGDCPPPRRDDWGVVTAIVHNDLMGKVETETGEKNESADDGKERQINREKPMEPKSEPENEPLVSVRDLDLTGQSEPINPNTIARNADTIDRATPGQDFVGMSR